MSVIFDNNLPTIFDSFQIVWEWDIPVDIEKKQEDAFSAKFSFKSCLFSFINPRLGRCKK
jgi:hypothetical protein